MRGIPGGVPGGRSGGERNVPSPPPPPPDSVGPPTVERVSGGVLAGKATHKINPAYPAMASAAGVEGAVVVEVRIDHQGRVATARAISGHPLLRDAAVDAARQWTFKPTVLSGHPVDVIGTITFNFRATKSPKPAA